MAVDISHITYCQVFYQCATHLSDHESLRSKHALADVDMDDQQLINKHQITTYVLMTHYHNEQN